MGTNSKQASILLVDDDRHILESMSQWLGEQGYSVDTAASFQEALQKLNKNHYQLGIVDVRLQDGDGFDILRHCREHAPQMTIILVTGYGSVEIGIDALREGAFDLLTKPLIDKELEMALNRALSQREVVEENRKLRAELDHRYGVDNIVIGSDHRMARSLRDHRQRSRHQGHRADHRRKWYG